MIFLACFLTPSWLVQSVLGWSSSLEECSVGKLYKASLIWNWRCKSPSNTKTSCILDGLLTVIFREKGGGCILGHQTWGKIYKTFGRVLFSGKKKPKKDRESFKRFTSNLLALCMSPHRQRAKEKRREGATSHRKDGCSQRASDRGRIPGGACLTEHAGDEKAASNPNEAFCLAPGEVSTPLKTLRRGLARLPLPLQEPALDPLRKAKLRRRFNQ